MPTTQLQIESNRVNALKSTGPVTPEGQAAVSGNALTHGLSSRRVLLPGEDPAVFAEFHRSLWEELQPEGQWESLAAEKAVIAAWRLERVAALETEILTRLGPLPDAASPVAAPLCGGVATALLEDARSGHWALDKLIRYEAHLGRVLRRGLDELLALQSRRRAATPPPAPPYDLVAEERHLRWALGLDPDGGADPYSDSDSGSDNGRDDPDSDPYSDSDE